MIREVERDMKKMIMVLCCIMVMLPMASAMASEQINFSEYFEGYTVRDARIIAQQPTPLDEDEDNGITSYGLILEQYNLGLEGEGKEQAKLAAETFMALKPNIVTEEELFQKGQWHFDVSIYLENADSNRELALSFYDSNRYSKFTVTDTKRDTDQPAVIYQQWCEVPLEAIDTLEELYLRRVCALVPDWSTGVQMNK